MTAPRAAPAKGLAAHAYLVTHRDRLAPRVTREVTCKLTTGRRSPPRRRRA